MIVETSIEVQTQADDALVLATFVETMFFFQLGGSR